MGIARPAPLVTETIGYPFGTLVNLLMLTAQRRGEVAGMRWSELYLDKRQWLIPCERTKNKRAHMLPLSDAAVELLTAVPRLNGTLVFPARGREMEVMSGFSKMKPKLEAICPIVAWGMHDLRRSAATGMARLGVPPHVVERVLNHSSGTFAGVAGVYNRFEYAPEMRDALELWARHIASRIPKQLCRTPLQELWCSGMCCAIAVAPYDWTRVRQTLGRDRLRRHSCVSDFVDEQRRKISPGFRSRSVAGPIKPPQGRGSRPAALAAARLGLDAGPPRAARPEQDGAAEYPTGQRHGFWWVPEQTWHSRPCGD